MATFRTTLEATGGNNVAIVVPEEIVLAFGKGKRVPVEVTIDGDYRYRTSIASMGGRFLVSFNAETRAATGRGSGDEVEVRLELDDAPRVVEIPDVLGAAFASNPDAARIWSTLSYSNQLRHALAISGAKSEETRLRRVEKTLAELRGGAR